MNNAVNSGSSLRNPDIFHARPNWKYDRSTHDQCEYLRGADRDPAFRGGFELRVRHSIAGYAELWTGPDRNDLTALPVTVENAGNSAIPITSVSVTPPFVLAPTPAVPRWRQTATALCRVIFDPTQAGDTTGTLTLAMVLERRLSADRDGRNRGYRRAVAYVTQFSGHRLGAAIDCADPHAHQ